MWYLDVIYIYKCRDTIVLPKKALSVHQFHVTSPITILLYSSHHYYCTLDCLTYQSYLWVPSVLWVLPQWAWLVVWAELELHSHWLCPWWGQGLSQAEWQGGGTKWEHLWVIDKQDAYKESWARQQTQNNMIKSPLISTAPLALKTVLLFLCQPFVPHNSGCILCFCSWLTFLLLPIIYHFAHGWPFCPRLTFLPMADLFCSCLTFLPITDLFAHSWPFCPWLKFLPMTFLYMADLFA